MIQNRLLTLCRKAKMTFGNVDFEERCNLKIFVDWRVTGCRYKQIGPH